MLSVQLSPVKGSPVSKMIMPGTQSTAPRPTKSVGFQPFRVLPSNNEIQPSPSKGAEGLAAAECRISLYAGRSVIGRTTVGAFVLEAAVWTESFDAEDVEGAGAGVEEQPAASNNIKTGIIDSRIPVASLLLDIIRSSFNLPICPTRASYSGGHWQLHDYSTIHSPC